jgi:hypothetical protein
MHIWRYFYVTFYVTSWKHLILVSICYIKTYEKIALHSVTSRKHGLEPRYPFIHPSLKNCKLYWYMYTNVTVQYPLIFKSSDFLRRTKDSVHYLFESTLTVFNCDLYNDLPNLPSVAFQLLA